ncbi:MAG: electron transfer flavoprotein subunit alpha/FixB family protein [Candidatus Thermoplasmatota archaeon]|nr:electron transfer flavoprotein subunit alpha/FixB family protein [Candidatus Thermoplasmatota archaeon]
MIKNKCATPPANIEAYKDLWIWLEQNDGELSRISLEMAGIGRRLADKYNERLVGILLADESGEKMAQEAIEYGVDKVIFAKNQVYRHYRTKPYADMISSLIADKKPNYFVIGATHNGRDLASRIAVRVNTGITADCTEIDIDPTKRLLEARRPAFGGAILANILCSKHRPQMASARPGIFKPVERVIGRKGEIERVESRVKEEEVVTKLLQIVTREEVDITTAEVVVCGGMGLGKKEGFKMLDELANELGGIVAASRPTVDAGWITRDRQVGQTGKTVHPKLYVAVGISGAIQHVAGMKSSDYIVSINKDAAAPIIKYSDVALIGDAYDIVPKLIDSIRKGKEQIKEGKAVASKK